MDLLKKTIMRDKGKRLITRGQLNIGLFRENISCFFGLVFLLVATIVITPKINAQSIGINENGEIPAESAMLDIVSTNKGVLIPRMTSVQREAISSKVKGLLVFDTNWDSFFYYDGNDWERLLRSVGPLEDVDGDTKIHVEKSPDEDVIRFDSKGVERMRIGSSGNVGIGTSQPKQKFVVAKNTAGKGIEIDPLYNNKGYIQAFDRGISDYYGMKIDAKSIGFGTGFGTERMFIDSIGNVGIGTSSPHAIADLHVTDANDKDTRIWLDSSPDAVMELYAGNGVGIFNRSNSHLILGTKGLERMRIGSSGNVGIGTSQPKQKFVVAKNTAGKGIEIDPLYNNKGYIQAFDRGISDYYGMKIDAKSIGFGTGFGTERMFIDSIGNVGIGTSSPHAIADLHVTDANDKDTRIWLDSSPDAVMELYAGNGVGIFNRSNSHLILGTKGLERMRIGSSGNVGIGTDNPSAKLSIEGGTSYLLDVKDVTETNPNPQIRFYEKEKLTGKLQTYAGHLYFDNRSTGSTYFRTGSSDKMTMSIDQNGNVGIGTVNPTMKLHVQGVGAAIGLFDTDPGSESNNRLARYGKGLVIQNGLSGNWKDNIVFMDNGNVGIGTSAPGMLLEVDASFGSANDIARFFGTNFAGLTLRNATDNVFVLHTALSDTLVFGTNGNNERMRIDSDGNVGIGYTNPSKKLHVNGSVGGTGAWNASDKRWKKDIKTVSMALDGIEKIRGVTYNWKNPSVDESTGFDDKTHYGVIAQEVEAVFPDLIDHQGDSEEYKHVEYNGLIGILIEAVKELKKQNETQQNLINSLNVRLRSLEME